MRESQPGALIGIYDYLFDKGAYRTRARALEPSRLLAIKVAALSRLIFRFPNIRGKLAPLDRFGRLRTLPLLHKVEEVGLGFLADIVEPLNFKENELIYASGDTESRLFMIDQGQVRLDGSASESHWLGNGAFFGLAADAGPRGPIGERVMRESATATMALTAFAVGHREFVEITGFVPDQPGLAEVKVREELLGNLIVFSRFDPRQRLQLAGFVSHNYYPSNRLLIQQGESADSMWVLVEGDAIIRALDNTGQKMISAVANGPTYFGETALLGMSPQDSTVEATGDSQWLRLHWHDFEEFDVIDPDDLRAKLTVKPKKTVALVGKEARNKYPWLLPGESVIYFSRRHWIAFFRKNAPTFILLGFLIVFLFVGSLLPGYQVWIAASILFLILLTLLALVWGIVDYMNDWLVVTDRRVVYQEKLLFVYQWRKEAPLEQINNVDYERHLLGRWLGFGTLVVQTAGSAGRIEFTYTTHIEKLRATISAERTQRQQQVVAESKMQIHRQLERRLDVAVAPPSRVYPGEIQTTEPETWRRKLARGTAVHWDEDGRTTWRKHWISLLPKIGWAWIIPAFGVLLGLVAWLDWWEGIPEQYVVASRAFQLLTVLLILVFIARLAWVIVDWYNDTYELTDNEIVNLRKLPFGLREDRSTAPLGRIQNVEMKIPSPIHLIFDYGNVVCHTAAEGGAVIFYAVPNPRAVAEEITARIQRLQRRSQEQDARNRAKDLPDWFEMYSRLAEDPTTQN
ncbi:MAG: cyclic nucleotide-binding domain-containing protein [Anaerolineales bacterium]|nr:cyclic nucleotide-binding domain-containing protein [Anaerolineales bacterium]